MLATLTPPTLPPSQDWSTETPTVHGAYMAEFDGVPERVEIIQVKGVLWMYSANGHTLPLSYYAEPELRPRWLKLDEQVHELKEWPQFFEPVAQNRKRFEFRRNDRDYKEGDALHLFEFVPCQTCQATGREPTLYGSLSSAPPCSGCLGLKGRYTGRLVRALVGYVLDASIYSELSGYVVLSLSSQILMPGDDWEPSEP